jgi:hypothetical protein
MNTYTPARLRPLLEFADILELAARETTLTLRKSYHERTRRRRGATLRPGAGTPLWNELARLAAHYVVRYGDKARLARVLGVPRQRVHEYLVSRTACPDTERALRLLAWVLARQAGHTPA